MMQEFTDNSLLLDDTDYISASTTVSFWSAIERKCVDIPLLDDDMLECTETFRVYLLSNDPTVAASGSPAIIFIENDDSEFNTCNTNNWMYY